MRAHHKISLPTMGKLPVIYDFLPEGAVAQPTYDLKELDIMKGDRPLTTSEVRQTMFQLVIIMLGYVEGDLDLDRAAKVCTYIGKLYRFMSSAIVFDPKIQWFRYKPQPPFVYDFSHSEMRTVTSFQDFSDIIYHGNDAMSATRLSNWEIVKVDDKRFPNRKYGIVMYAAHAFGDGSNFQIMLKIFNKLYMDQSIDFSKDPEPIQLSNFKALCALPYGYKPKQKGQFFDGKGLTKINECYKGLKKGTHGRSNVYYYPKK